MGTATTGHGRMYAIAAEEQHNREGVNHELLETGDHKGSVNKHTTHGLAVAQIRHRQGRVSLSLPNSKSKGPKERTSRMCVPPENEAGGQEAGNFCKVILSVWWHYLPLTFFSYIILINVQKYMQQNT